MLHQLPIRPNLPYPVPTPNSPSTLVFEKRLFINATPELLWKLLTQPHSIPKWNQSVKQVVNYPDALEEPTNLTGCEQKVIRKDGQAVTQVITDWKQGALLGYATVEGSLYPGLQAELEIEVFKLKRGIQGTEVHLLSYIEWDSSLPRPTCLKKFRRENHAKLIFLKWLAEHTRPTNR